MYYSSLFWELSLTEEFRNKRSIENREYALLSEQSPLFPEPLKHVLVENVQKGKKAWCNQVGKEKGPVVNV